MATYTTIGIRRETKEKLRRCKERYEPHKRRHVSDNEMVDVIAEYYLDRLI